MLILPVLRDKTIPRPDRPLFEESYRIPDTLTYTKFWSEIYVIIKGLKIYSPVIRDVKNYINPLFGYFGLRVHPVTNEPKYFHTGISLSLKFGRKIYPILPGILEYSGYGAVNGHYILLSHPQIQTEDGYFLHSMYCHLKKPLVKFNSYQKMLRGISLGSHPVINVDAKTILGNASTSGLSRDGYPGLYLQLSFRKFDRTPILIDPMRAYYKGVRTNSTKDIVDNQIINQLFGTPQS
ncbi:MAG: hypothetical protein ACI870_000259 [Crocinitomicaceae bacterium]|jgi:hypothetical protein